MKAYTDLSQSKRLAEILPLESADMRFCFSHTLGGRVIGHYPMIGREPSMGTVPCWSLAALLDILHDYTLQTNSDRGVFVVCDSKKPMISDSYSNPVDACVDMILLLKERGLI